MDRLLQGPAPVVMVSLGNPYLLRTYPGVAAYLTTFSNSAPSELAAVKALFGEIPVAGKSPVSIPGIAPLGAGITIPVRTPATTR
jgi:beta-N-acetylhexosaminidase